MVAGIGSVRLKLSNGSVKILLGVRHVPELKRNLISLGILDFSGGQAVLGTASTASGKELSKA